MQKRKKRLKIKGQSVEFPIMKLTPKFFKEARKM